MIADVDVLKMCIGSPFLVENLSFETVTPELIVKSAPESSIKGVEEAPSQFELIVNAVDKILPPLHRPAKADEGKIRIGIKAKPKVKNFFKVKVNCDYILDTIN